MRCCHGENISKFEINVRNDEHQLVLHQQIEMKIEIGIETETQPKT